MNQEFLDRRRAEILLAAYSFFCLAALLKHWDLWVRAVKALLFFFFAPSAIALSSLMNYGIHLAPRIPAMANAFQENQILQQKLQFYSLLETELRDLRGENDRLRDALHFDRRRFPDAMACEVVARDPVHWFSSVILNRGEGDGLQVGMPVIAESSGRVGLVGRVEEATQVSAKVLLISDVLSSVSVSIGPKNELAVLQGQDSDDLCLNFIVPQAEVQGNDEIVTAGLGETIPSGIPVGRLAAFSTQATLSFRQASVQSYAPLGRLATVWVLKSPRRQRNP
jgi:rod shape-determining protein MreC